MAQHIGGIDLVQGDLPFEPRRVALAAVQLVAGVQGAPGQHPAPDHIAEQFQIGVSGGQHVSRTVGGGLAVQQPEGGVLDCGDSGGEAFERFAGIQPRQGRKGGLHVRDQVAGRLAAVHRQLAADQIHGLNAVGALIDRGDASVAIVLGRAGLLDETHAAVDLQAHGGDLAAHIGGPGLGDRREQVLAALPATTRLFGGRVFRQIGGDAGRQADRPGGGDLRLHHRQHATDIGVIDDRGVGFAGPDRPALAPVLGIDEGVLVSSFGDAHALDADRQSRGVHHHEHMGQALVRLADQFGGGALIGHDAGRRGVDAQLVLQPDGPERIARPQGPVLVQQIFGGEEQADALRSRRGIGQPGQNQMDDVVRGVVIAPGDVDLLARQAVGPVAVGRSRRRQGAEIRARLRLGQDHGAGPLAADQPGEIGFLLRGRSVGLQRLDRRQRQHRAQAEGHIGRMDGLEGRQLERLGQLLAADVGRGGQAGPAAPGELAIGVGEARCGRHRITGQGRALLVADPVQRGQHAFRKLRRRLEHGAQQIGVIVGKGAGGRDPVDPGHGLQGEGEVTDGSAVGHRNGP